MIKFYNFWKDNKVYYEDSFFPLLAITYNQKSIWIAVLGFGIGIGTKRKRKRVPTWE